MTIILNIESNIRKLDLSSYMKIPINEEQISNQIENIFQNKQNNNLKMKDSNYIHYFNDCNRKIESFLKYNSIVNMSFYNNKIFFEEWSYKQKVEAYLDKSKFNKIMNLIKITFLII